MFKAHMDRYDDGGPNLNLCLEAQKYYEEQKSVTRVKAAGMINAGEAKQLAGVDSMTIAPDLFRMLSKTEEPEVDVIASSLFSRKDKASEQTIETHDFVDNEKKYREAFARSYGGKGAWKTEEVCADCSQFCRLLIRFSRRSESSASTRSKQRDFCEIPRRLRS